MEELISVVVPVYNVEKYLRKCIDSVISQSYQNFEIILVDDGSTDGSGKICDSFTDPRIKVIHKENSGPSDTRNVGNAAAEGKYITWLDSDDTLHRDYLKIMLSMCLTNSAQLAACEILSHQENDYPNDDTSEYKVKVCDGISAMKDVLKGKMHDTSACALLIESELAKKYPFPVGKYHEDDRVTYKFFADAKTVAYTDKPMYYYMQRMGSIMHTATFGKIDLDELEAADEIYDACNQMGKEFGDAAYVKKVKNYVQILLKFDDLKKIDENTFCRIIGFVYPNFSKILISKDYKIKFKIKLALYRMGLYKPVKRIVFKVKGNIQRAKIWIRLK